MIRALVLLLALAACEASPAPEFFGAERSEHIRDGRTYVVYRKDARFEVVRLGYAQRSDHAAIRESMLALVPDVTGCRINPRTLSGDSGEMRGTLNC